MMTTSYLSSEVDRQYFDDNMLTDEDFHFDPDGFLNLTMDEPNSSDAFPTQMQVDLRESQVTPPNTDSQFPDALDMGHIDEFLKSCLYQNNLKFEPLSPYGNSVASPENDISVISIPEDPPPCSGVVEVINDTPPQTPPGLHQNSPPKHNFNPIIVSVSSVPTVTYIVPPMAAPPPKLRMNIQPKPEPPDVDTSCDAKKAFDSDEVVQLPKGIFQMKQPASKVAKPAKATPPAAQPVRKEVPKPTFFDTCTAALKRQERIIKNRESAYLSRKRKKEHVQKLEDELKKITVENSSLKEENSRLRLRISNLEKELLSLKATFTSKGMKKSLCLMVVVFMLTFNVASYSSVFQKTIQRYPRADLEPDHHIGRNLLWDEENSTKEGENGTLKSVLHNSFLKDDDDSAYIVSWDKSFNTSSCQQFINKSESLRLEKDLLGFVKRAEKKQTLKAKKMNKFVADLKNSIIPLPKLQQLGLKYRNKNKDVWAKRKNQNEILIYQTFRKDYEDFFDAIHRRDDSFYFVSFSGDHLLLPAIAHNQTLRPRMSFVMPAMILNDSVEDSDDHISMMQIDCEVLDTKLVHIKESVIPPHLRQKHANATSSRAPQHPPKKTGGPQPKKLLQQPLR
ncbi:hypothetical protein JTE90_013208 [Oedothorax gibbosus]|uniref:BZIP domain-containing protein n=1 Tax=Oedothorax gibbosus TaxID=931172 RepID=A0AAV6UJ88_9ARAC|nr:hypothetical protein JTE90_013208 [Oedothorax gibbosus]